MLIIHIFLLIPLSQTKIKFLLLIIPLTWLVICLKSRYLMVLLSWKGIYFINFFGVLTRILSINEIIRNPSVF